MNQMTTQHEGNQARNESTVETLVRVIAWSADAAREHVSLARFVGEAPDSQPGMGLWQAFQAAFPKEDSAGRNLHRSDDRDLLVAAWAHTFTATVKALEAIAAEAVRQ